MHKGLLLIIALIFSSQIKAQTTYDMPLKDGKIFYQEVANQQGTPAELFNRAFEYFKDYFPNFSSAITKKDENNHVIEGIVRVNLTTTDKKGRVQKAGRIRYEFKIECKEGKYRISIYNFRMNDNSGNQLEEWFKDTNEGKVAIHTQHFQQIDKAVKEFIKKFHEGMKPEVEVDDSW
jgi:hypothetical protein